MDWLIETVRSNPLPFAALGFLLFVAILGWVIETSSYRYRHH